MSPQPDFSALLRLIHERRSRVARLVNRELIDLYWEIGHYLDDRINQDGWGKGTVRYLSDFLLSHEPGLRGFSSSNLWRMRQFCQTWRGASEKIATLLRDLPWSSHVDLLGRCRSDAEREFYLRFAIQENFSVRDLRRAIEKNDLPQVQAELTKYLAALRSGDPRAKGPTHTSLGKRPRKPVR